MNISNFQLNIYFTFESWSSVFCYLWLLSLQRQVINILLLKGPSLSPLYPLTINLPLKFYIFTRGTNSNSQGARVSWWRGLWKMQIPVCLQGEALQLLRRQRPGDRPGVHLLCHWSVRTGQSVSTANCIPGLQGQQNRNSAFLPDRYKGFILYLLLHATI